MAALVSEHIAEGMPALGRVGDDALVVAVGEDPAAPAEHPVDGARDPDLEALDAAARKQIYGNISRIIAEDQPVLFLTFPRANHGIQANVAGVDVGMRLGWNFPDWYFTQP